MSNFHRPLDEEYYDRRNDPQMYVDVMSSDGVSTITGPIGHGGDFDPVGVYLPPEPNDIPPSYRYDEAEEEGVGEDENEGYNNNFYNSPSQFAPEDDFDPQGLGPDDFDPVGAYLPPDDPHDLHDASTNNSGAPQHRQYNEEYPTSQDIRGMDRPPDLPPQGLPPSHASYENDSNNVNYDAPETSKRNEYNARVEEWYNQMEQTAEDQMDDTTTRLEPDEVVLDEAHGLHLQEQARMGGLHSKQDSFSTTESEWEARQARTRCVIITVVVVAIIIVGAVVGAVVFLLGGDSSSNDATPASRDSSNVPTSFMPSDPPASAPSEAKPTPSPTVPQVDLQLLRSFDEESSRFVSVVLHVSRFILMGSQSNETGMVSTFFNNGNDSEEWTPVPALTDSSESAYGSDIDVYDGDGGNSILLVGAPQDGDNSSGSVYLYSFDEGNNQWKIQGPPILGSNSTLEEFGYSVALSDNMHAVIGAPGANLDSGLVYTFTLSEAANGVLSADPLVATPLPGSGPGSRFGEALDITPEGNDIAVGEPGQSRFSIYTWDGAAWDQTITLSVSNSQDFGSSVTFLSDNYLAVGAPSFNGERGVIQVFARGSGGIWTALPTIAGLVEGDYLGGRHSLSGQEGPQGPEVVVGTKNGALERFDYDASVNRWLRRFTVDYTDAVASVSSLRLENEISVLVGFSGATSAVLYSETLPSTPTTLAPTKSPSMRPTTRAPTTSAPSPSPTQSFSPSLRPSSAPTKHPTCSPSESPTRTKEWRLVGGPFVSSVPATAFGHAVAILDDVLFIGEPDFDSTGRVTVLQRSSEDWTVVAFETTHEVSKFGTAVDAAVIAGKPSALVGAIETSRRPNEQVGSLKFGSSHSFEYNGQEWNEIGGEILPNTSSFLEASGKFGTSVSVAWDIQRIAVGAPDSSGTTSTKDSGIVFVFDFNGVDWEQKGDPLLGPRLGMFLGASVDISSDGSLLLAGAPLDGGGDGSAFLFEWTGVEWSEIFMWQGVVGFGEELGIQVSFVTNDGTTIAIGSPNWNGGRGAVRIYEKSGLSYLKVMDVEGLVGERLGATLCGENGRVAAGTEGISGGLYRVYGKANGSWTEVSTSPRMNSNVASIAMTSNPFTVAVGLANEEVQVYEYS